jgi:serine/threonine-protein kinase
MPTRIFAITAARETATLDNEGRAEVSFTASNTGPKSIAGRVKLVPLGSTKAAWLSLEGEQERNFARGEAHQLTVHIGVPPGTPVGKYSFRLNIISVENPDDEFTEGPSVSFEVKELTVAQAPPRKFPWWILAVAGVLVLGGGIITWLLIPQKVTMPDVVGRPYKEAVNDLNAKKLKPTAEEKVSGTQKPGIVIEQNPKAKEVVRVDSEVKLVVEATPELVAVPRLIGRSIDEAEPVLRKEKLLLTKEAKPGGSTPGTIVDQKPKPDEHVAPGTMVTAFFEPEPEMVTVPGVIGVAANEVEPIFKKEKLEYQVMVQGVITGKVSIGAIADQSPAKDQRVPVGTKVTLRAEAISVEVPNVIGKTVGDAIGEIRSRKLEDFMDPHEEPNMWDIVRSQSPEPRTRVAPRTRVTISAR